MEFNLDRQQTRKELRPSNREDLRTEQPLKMIARIHTDFPTKFGIPRQSGLVETLKGKLVFEPEYRNPDAFRGLEGFSHLWLIWGFSEALRDTWSPMVKPPRLGGNKRMGVFATRSPFRPNSIGLSSVKLDKIELESELGPVLYITGADLMDGTPIYDIKPYLPYTDSHPEAIGGFADPVKDYELEVVFPEQWLSMIPDDKREALIGVLAQDPRPSYQQDPNRIYGVEFAGYDTRFTVKENVLTVCEVEPLMK
ncbi:MAG: putative methyltransferase, YaeB/AF family [Herbinix sp.]|jgi:tRNA-Thr(GGU) m(6)t(6)A37 methyltransferase TsaA|nr:putative methyltransferase, YaeB/AF family [Herbinix sp.]